MLGKPDDARECSTEMRMQVDARKPLVVLRTMLYFPDHWA